MKKLLLAIALLLPMVAYADRVKADKAQEIAYKFMNPGGTKAGGKTLRLVWRGEKPGEAVSVDPAFYVFNADGGGFVVVSGEDAMTPILAYSMTQAFPAADNMAPGLKDWMEGLQAAVAQVRREGLKPTAAVREAWTDAAASGPARDGGDEVVIETALWDQGDPYNRLCPEVDGGKSVTGCAATAIAIIMYNYKHPTKGTGNLPSYNYTTNKGNDRHQDGKKLGKEYDWDNMLMSYKGSFTDAQANAVAELMLDVGIMAKMEYNSTGSAAITSSAAFRLSEFMGYDKSMRHFEKGYMSAEDWIEMISEEIDEGRLVLYSARDNTGGHAFVCDGYRKSDNYLRFNWGWSGSGNGFFAISDMAGFTINNNAVFGIAPDHGGEEPKGYVGYTTLSTTQKTITKGEPFTVTVKEIVTQGGSVKEAVLTLAKLSGAGEIREFPSDALFINLDTGYYYPSHDFNVTINTDILPGDYLLPIYTYGDVTDSEPDDWYQALWYQDGGGNEKMVLMSEDSVLESTRFNFNATTRVMTITTLAETTVTLTDSKGKDWSSAVKGSGGTFTVNGKELTKGTYTVTLTINGVSKSFDVTL